MSLVPFRAILGNIDPESFEKQPDGDFNTGFRFNGKDIFKRTLEFSQISNWIPDAHDDFFLKAEGMLFDWTYYVPAKIKSISNGWIVLEQDLANFTDWYIDLYFTETEENKNRMSKFVVLSIFALAITGILLYSPEVVRIVMNY